VILQALTVQVRTYSRKNDFIGDVHNFIGELEISGVFSSIPPHRKAGALFISWNSAFFFTAIPKSNAPPIFQKRD
jgi:hypothetical protein